MMHILVSKPWITKLEREYAAEAVASGWVSSTGPFIERAESAIAQMAGAAHAVTTCNGTAALHLALLALDVRPGDEVIVPSLTFVAVANAVRYVGAEPVFVDVDPVTWCIDPSGVERARTRRTRGVIAVHSYGHPADLDAIARVTPGLWIVEDAAEAHFAKYRGRSVGGITRVGVFSFYGNKIVVAGEGGALVTRDADLAARARLIRGQGMSPERRYYFPVVGNNFRMTNVAAAILCAQLERAPEIIEERGRVYRRYAERLGGKLDLQGSAADCEVAPWMFCALLRDRDEVAARLASGGIDTRPFFYPLHWLPSYRSGVVELPHTEDLASRGINLPTYPELTNEQIDEVCKCIF